jgi:hypothetical protein
MAQDKKKNLFAEIPEKVHQALKITAVRQGTSIRAITEKAIKTYLRLK